MSSDHLLKWNSEGLQNDQTTLISLFGGILTQCDLSHINMAHNIERFFHILLLHVQFF